MTTDERTDALTDLVALRRPLGDALAAVRALPWDSDVELVVVGPSDVRSVLQRFLRREVTAEGVEQWADALESRDDVAVDPRVPDDLLHALATPELEGVLTPPRAEELVAELEGQQPG